MNTQDLHSAESADIEQLLLQRIQKIESQVQELHRGCCGRPAEQSRSGALNLVVMDNSLDRLMAAFIIATGAAACGMTVRMFFTFWATAALRERGKQVDGKTLVEKVLGWMLPGSLRRTRLSRLNMFGLGRHLLKMEMRRKGVADLDRMVEAARELGIQIFVCETSMNLLGIQSSELMEYPQIEVCGVATFVEHLMEAHETLFI